MSRNTLHLMKHLAGNGFAVTVEPEDGTRLQYVSEKGLYELVSDPILLFLVNVPVSLIVALLANSITARPNQEPSQVIIQTSEDGTSVHYTATGKPVSEQTVQKLLQDLRTRQDAYRSSLASISPYESRPIALHLEHSGRIVGWGTVSVEGKGVLVKDAVITDDETFRRIDTGELQGFSIAGLVTNSECAICGAQYVDCTHIAGRTYSNRECVVRLKGFDIAEVSIVKEPVNPLCTLHRGKL